MKKSLKDKTEETRKEVLKLVRKLDARFDTKEYQEKLKKELKELDHSNGVCGKTRKHYREILKYVNTLGKYGPLSGVAGTEITCSECGQFVGYKGSYTMS